MTALERAWRFDAERQERSARRVRRFELGAAIYSADLPRVYDANLVRLDRGYEDMTGDELVRITDSLQGELAHRKVLMPGGDGGVRLARALRGRGWAATETVVMEHPSPAGRDPRSAAGAEQVDPRALRGAREAATTHVGAEAARQVAEYTERLALAGPSRAFAAFDGGEVAAFCMLLESDGVGEIDEVTTLDRFRRRGHGTAVVEAALAASGASGHDLTFLVAAAHDWPRRWYERLGFEEIGGRWELYRA